MKPPSPADANQSIESRLADAIAAKYGVERVPIPEPQVAQVTPSSGWRDANRPAPPSPFSASAQASPNKAVIAPQAVPAITPVPAGPPKVVDPVEARLAEAIAKRYATPAQNTPAPPQAKPTQEPASTEETQPAPAQKYTPSKGTFGGYYPRAAEEAKGKEAKVKEGKAGKKTPNFYYYDTLGVPRGDNVAAAHALTALRKKASEEPQRITPQEDRLLAASGQTEAFNLPMTPEAVAERFIQYGAGGKPSASAPKKWDAKPMNAPAGNTFQQGQRDPTVDQRDPAAMVSRSIDKATTKPIKEQAPDPVEPDDEKDD
jgi:hypothetical protein